MLANLQSETNREVTFVVKEFFLCLVDILVVRDSAVGLAVCEVVAWAAAIVVAAPVGAVVGVDLGGAGEAGAGAVRDPLVGDG